MRALLAVLLLAVPVLAKEKYKGGDGAQEAPDHKPRFEEDPALPKDQGWRAIGLGGPDLSADPAPSFDDEELRDNILTVLTTHLAPTEGRWLRVDPKTGAERRLKLDRLGDIKAAGPGRYAARARFKDAAGAVEAELLADLGSKRWKILKLAPAGKKR